MESVAQRLAFYHRLLGSALVLMLAGCGQADFLGFEENAQGEPVRNASLSEMKFRQMRIDRGIAVTLGKQNDYFDFGQGGNFYEFLQVPESSEPLTLFVIASPFKTTKSLVGLGSSDCDTSGNTIYPDGSECGRPFVNYPAVSLYDENFELIKVQQPELSFCMVYGAFRGITEDYDFALRFSAQVVLPEQVRYLTVYSRRDLDGTALAVPVADILDSKATPYLLSARIAQTVTEGQKREYAVASGGELELLPALLPDNVNWPDPDYPDRCLPRRVPRKDENGVRKRQWAIE